MKKILFMVLVILASTSLVANAGSKKDKKKKNKANT